MTTRLEKELRREIDIGGKPYTVTLSPEGIRLTGKGRRKGHELRWQDWVSGEAALAVALNASLRETAAPSSNAKVEPPQGIEPPIAKRGSKKRAAPARTSSRSK